MSSDGLSQPRSAGGTLHPDGTKPVAKNEVTWPLLGAAGFLSAFECRSTAVGPPRPGRHSAQRFARLPAPRKVGACHGSVLV